MRIVNCVYGDKNVPFSLYMRFLDCFPPLFIHFKSMLTAIFTGLLVGSSIMKTHW